MKVVAYTRPDGGFSVVYMQAAFAAQFNTEDEGIAAILAKDVPPGITDAVIADEPDQAQMEAWHRADPTDNAMTLIGGRIAVDMPKARTVHANRVEAARRLKARDVIERETVGEDVTAEKAQLQAMNVGPQIAAAANPVALDAVWPAGLPRPSKG